MSFCIGLGTGLAACGGTARPDGDGSTADAGGSGGSASSSASSGAVGGSATSGDTGSGASTTDGSSTSTTGAGGSTSADSSATTAGAGGSTGEVCCNAVATCPSGWYQVGPGSCRTDAANCMTVTVCCDTITCLQEVALCDGYPSCENGDSQVSECPADASCYERSLCGATILCQDVACAPADEPYRNYAAMGDDCQTVAFDCLGESAPFSNDCGCGCEQDRNCPAFVDCMPGGAIDPLCDDADTCPLTERAQ